MYTHVHIGVYTQISLWSLSFPTAQQGYFKGHLHMAKAGNTPRYLGP